ncbi:aminobenzoate synthetase [Mycobacterium sp. IS-1742]|uniref:aminobenzoate synthetase n=1 Tax=Mycobacterium sp. IS-1742 TaxID=1772285 RepID=UPI0007400194|nr:aminobenzoate synthetase [Mycobacterium sp. IS-1742]KUI31666.1 aminobenzoate synthetase [Mycobacterium sp. IS-1742]
MEVGDLARRLADTGACTVLIDGRSGSGKTTLAAQLHQTWDGSAIIALDDIYAGWDGLAWAVEHLRVALLEPRAAGRPGRWRRWDWTTGTPADWHTVEPDRRVIIEGVGALNAAHRALADLGIWVDAREADRKRRALARDGDTYAPHWDRWAVQEEAFIARYDPRSVADWIATYSEDGLRWAANLS